ncbi:hypothetical protein ABZ897_46925 [Nonomuraea sp. NPDC046802]|uniref:hypothetical protein n=1 Tax=Nonomuraea sp. NPDC046802 TaxID=3154919 RepID=UPI0033F72107
MNVSAGVSTGDSDERVPGGRRRPHRGRARAVLPPAVYEAVEDGLEGWLKSTRCDDGLVDLVRLFQRDEGISDDGIIGPKTWPSLLRV